MFALRNTARVSSCAALSRSVTSLSMPTSSSRCAPPCKSRPSVTVCFGNQLGIASSVARGIRLGIASTVPTSSTMRTMAVFQVGKCSMAGRALAATDSAVVGALFFLLHRLRLAGHGGDGVAHDLDLHAIGDLDHQVVVGNMRDLSVDAAIGDDAVAALQGRDHGAMLLLLLLLRTDQQEPHDDEDEDERRERREHLEAARRTPSGLCPSFRNQHERAP